MEQPPRYIMLAIISNDQGFRIEICSQRSAFVFLQQVFIYYSNFKKYSGVKERIIIKIITIIYRKVVNLVLGIVI